MLPRSLSLGGLASLAVVVLTLPATPTATSTAARRVHVDAGNFAFTPATIEVNPGDRVTIELAASDVVHGFHIDGYDVTLTADPGQPASVTFVADRPGVFRIHCSVPCGPLHPFMAGRLRVGPPLAFWRVLALAALAVAFGGVVLRRRVPGAGIKGPP